MKISRKLTAVLLALLLALSLSACGQKSAEEDPEDGTPPSSPAAEDVVDGSVSMEPDRAPMSSFRRIDGLRGLTFQASDLPRQSRDCICRSVQSNAD